MRHICLAITAVLVLGRPAAATAQDRSGAAEDGDDIIVTGVPERGAVTGDIKPEEQLRPADIRALGVSSISELVSELSPQTNATGGQPVILLNGKRISSFAEIQDLPAEAVARVDILPEEVALSYGYAPDQKVVNIVLRRRFRAELADLRAGTTSEGGGENGSAEGGLMRIAGDNRLTVNLKYSAAAQLLESERGIIEAAPRRPYALGGNIGAPLAGAEIDPALSALAGEPVTVAAVPASAVSGAPSLADFVAGANNPQVSDIGKYRTLSPASRDFSANATLARAFGDVSMSLNGRLEISSRDSLQGLPSLLLSVPAGSPWSPFGNDILVYRYLDQKGALAQSADTTTGHVGLTLNGGLAPRWQWSFTGNADIASTRTRTDRGFPASALQAAIGAGDPSINPFGPIPDSYLATRIADSARSLTRSIGGDMLLSGQLFALPAGAATAAIRLGGSAEGASSSALRSQVATSADYARETGDGQVSIDMPLTSRSKDVLGALGDIGANINARARHLSDFGTLSTLGYGLRWTPIPQVRLLVSASQDRAAPTGAQINSPAIVTPNVAVFDYRTGETVLVTQISGGNPTLKASVQDQFRLSATIKPLKKPDLTLTASYLNSRSRDPIAAFPTASAPLENAFPDRFVRDGAGALVEIDARPINFAQSRSARLRWGIDLSVPLKSAIQKRFEAWRAAGAKPEDRPRDLRALFGDRAARGAGTQDQNSNQRGEGGDGQAPAAGPNNPAGPGGRPGGFGGRYGGFGGRQGGGGGRLQFSLYHTWYFTDRILIAPGLRELDLLNGDAAGSSGGQPRHQVEARLGYSNNGLGARLSVDWQSGTHVDGALDGSSRLNFGSLATADLRLFANLGQMPSIVRAHPFFRGTRVALAVTNLLDSRQSVTDATGATPIRYQPGYLDPQGRAITISFRKLFF